MGVFLIGVIVETNKMVVYLEIIDKKLEVLEAIMDRIYKPTLAEKEEWHHGR